MFVFAAGLLWAVSIASSWNSPCPRLGGGYEPVGLDKGISFWPPAAQCVDGNDHPYWFESHPWMGSVSLGLLVCAVLIVVIGAIADARVKRSSPSISAAADAPYS